MFHWFSKILLSYKEALWPEKLASQILTNDRQILVLSQLSNHTTVTEENTI